MTQCERILKYMKTNDGITSLEAVLYLKCTRLAARISDLEKQGHRIRRERIPGDNYVRYYLEETK